VHPTQAPQDAQARVLRTEDFDYELPSELIAQAPLPRRSDARLLVLERRSGAVSHHRVADLPRLLRPGDLLVVNDSRVLPARLRVRRPTGGRAEVLLLHPAAGDPAQAGSALEWVALARPARRLRPGEFLLPLGPDGTPAPTAVGVRIVEHLGEGQVAVRLEGVAPHEVAGLLERYGQVPLPPYIRAPLQDPERYQTVYARVPGSAAAPTAGLHFTPELLAELEAAGIERAAVTLHVGLGTFRPVTADDPARHRMHAEWCCVPPETAEAVARARRRGGRVVAVGTTVVRTLESRATEDGGVRAGSGWTDLYILPGWRFRAVDALLTNFHLPRSTLLMLVCAFAGRQPVLAAYREAVRLRYRFFSFGDAMLVW
jgi:S-adenosylmethionine:tRNA ribosyltransferase-isomerase